MVAAILGTREGAKEAGYELLSTGVTWTDQRAAAELRDALAARKVENVMLVSSFLAAAALAQAVGSATGYMHHALLYVEPDTATLAVVNTNDGSIIDVQRQQLPDDDDQAVATLINLASAAEGLDLQPEGLLVVGSGVDIPLIKPALESATSLPLSVPEHPETALARGAALASASAPLFASSTAALAYAQDPGTGSVSQHANTPGYLAVAEAAAASAEVGPDALAYSAVADDSAAIYTDLAPDAYAGVDEQEDFTTGMYPDFGRLEQEPESRTTVSRGDGCADDLRHRRDGAGDFAGLQHPAVGRHAAQPEPQRDCPGPPPGSRSGSASGSGSTTGTCAGSRTRSGAGPRARSRARSGSGTASRGPADADPGWPDHPADSSGLAAPAGVRTSSARA